MGSLLHICQDTPRPKLESRCSANGISARGGYMKTNFKIAHCSKTVGCTKPYKPRSPLWAPFCFSFSLIAWSLFAQKSVATKQISTWEKQYPHWFDWLRWPDNFVGLVGFYGNFMRILSKPLLVPSWSEVSAIDPAETASTSLYTQKHHLPWSPGQHSLNKFWRHNASIEIKTEILNRQVG